MHQDDGKCFGILPNPVDFNLFMVVSIQMIVMECHNNMHIFTALITCPILKATLDVRTIMLGFGLRRSHPNSRSLQFYQWDPGGWFLFCWRCQGSSLTK
jgi:hypothetical protein